MAKYVSWVICMRNGSRLRHMKNYKRGPVKYAEAVKVMDGNGTVDTSPDNMFYVDYAVPTVDGKHDWSDVVDETWSFELNNGTRDEYTGVRCLEMGEMTVDNEKEAVITLTFHYESRTAR